MKIWWQSFVDEAQNAPYLARLSAYLEEAAVAECEISVVGMEPPDRWFSRLTELRCGVVAVDNALEAEAQGYDAFVFGHFQEPCLVEARHSVAIPVVGLGETSLERAVTLGRSLVLVSIDEAFIDYHWEQVARCGVRDRVAAVLGLGLRVEDFAPAFAGDDDAYDGIVSEFRRLVEPFVARGADVVVPAGGLFSLLVTREPGFAVGDAPVINCLRAALEDAEACVRESVPNADLPPSEAVGEFRAFVAGGRTAATASR